MRDQRHGVRFALAGQFALLPGGRQQVRGREVLSGQNAIDGVERKLAAAVKKIGEMALAKARLTRQQRDAECSPLNPAQQFQPETFVHLGKVHLWKICRQP